MLKTLYSKLVLVNLLVCSALVFLFLVLIQFALERNQQIVTQRLQLQVAQMLVRDLHLAPGPVDLERLRRGFDWQLLANPEWTIYLLDDKGEILTSSLPTDKVPGKRVALRPLTQLVADPAALPLLNNDPADPQRKKIFSVAPIPEHGSLQGYLYVILEEPPQQNIVHLLRQGSLGPLGLWVIAGILLAAIVAGMLTFAVLTQPLKRLAASMEVFQRGNFSSAPVLLPVTANRPGDEIDRLGAAFNQMAARIAVQLRALQQTDQARQEFLANVSHDLRTPLAALRGYLETLLLKEETLSPQERHNYLEIATKQSERLTNMVAKLFELAKLDANQVMINRENFLIGDLIEDVAQKFQLAAGRNGINLYTRIPEEQPLVNADIGLMERVLENLIENAMRYTVNGGGVGVIMNATPRQVTVEVKDTGNGIAEHDLPHVFERFYRGDKSRSSDSGNAGLGLAIVKSILERHGSEIKVASALGAGTTFSFVLPAVA
ncbi:MAG: sensor histidine kinase [Burkholderiales bacterium]